jgi:glycerophosphoryl diester phosphodiesterase
MNTFDDSLLCTLLSSRQSPVDQALAARYAPIIRFDDREPFLPLAAGYTIWRQDGVSPSFRQGRTIELAPPGERAASLAVEYAIWWDWDIGHLYELEHVWVYADAIGRVVRCEASWHGGYHSMRHDGELALKEDRPIVYSEPGKHAFAPTPEWFLKRRQEFKRSETSALAGCSGVLVTSYLQGRVTRTPLSDLLVRSYLAQHAFEPSWRFENWFGSLSERLVPWLALADWIPARVENWLDKLAHDISPADYRFLRIGHRGAAAHAPDNTLSGLLQAAQLGADMVEFDVQRTADGHAILVHDTHLVDAEGRNWPVRQSNLARLQTIDLGQGTQVPTLEQALELCLEQQLGVYIEIKDGAVVADVAAAVRKYDMASTAIAASFRPDWLAELKAQAPEISTSILFGSPHLDAVKLAQSIQASYVHPCWERLFDRCTLLSPQWLARARRAGLGIICWHEEDPQAIAALRRVGVDGICSDAPELLW